MWRYAESYSKEEPKVLDDFSSELYVYVRKDFIEIPVYDKNNNRVNTRWNYKEYEILKEEWNLFKDYYGIEQDDNKVKE